MNTSRNTSTGELYGHSLSRTGLHIAVCRTHNPSFSNGCAASSQQSRKHGYFDAEASKVTDEWKNPVFNATSAYVSEKVRKSAAKELNAGWLPSSTFAEMWLTFVRRSDPIAIWKP